MGEFFDVAGSALSTILGVVFWIFIVRLIIGLLKPNAFSKKGKTASQKKPKAPAQRASFEEARKQAEQTAAARKKTAAKKREQKKLYRAFDPSGGSVHDSADDWLSQQLKEERKSLREVSAMFELKMHHQETCAAERLRESHAENCDAEKVKRASRK